MKKSLIISSILVLASFTSNAGLINDSFETGDLSSWNSSGKVTVAGSTDYEPGSVNPFNGTSAARLVSSGTEATDLASIMGISKAELEASNDNTTATDGSLVYQSISNVLVGDSFSFSWNFVEQDYMPFDDWAFYGISLNGGPAEVSKFASLGTVGPDDDTTINGWETVSFDITEAGDYTFYFGIVNAEDRSLDSDLWIDGVSLDTTPIPTPSTLTIFALGIMGLVVRRFKKQA